MVAARSQASSREDACARTPAPQRLRQYAPHRKEYTRSRAFNPFGGIRPVREDST